MNQENILNDMKKRMDGAISSLEKALSSMRTNRAHTGLVENIIIDYQGMEMPISQLAQISVSDGQMLIIQPWDKSISQSIARAISSSDIGMQPNVDGDFIRLSVPALTQERRNEIVKLVKKRTEEGKIAIRNVRRSSIEDIRSMEKNSDLSQDESRRIQSNIQEITDESIKIIDEKSLIKENEVLND